MDGHTSAKTREGNRKRRPTSEGENKNGMRREYE